MKNQQVMKAIEEKNQSLKNELNNLRTILKALPENETAARDLIADQIAIVIEKLPKPKNRMWWHWVMEKCPTCKCQFSQRPVADILGQDCLLFGEIDKYSHLQEDDDAVKCPDCKEKLVLVYRHATADMTEEQKQDAFSYEEIESEY